MTASTRPGGMPTIQPRHMDFVFDDAIPCYWFDDDPCLTLLFTALSSSFPDGERFIMKAVRQYQGVIADPGLRAAVHGFIGQEAHHGRQHEGLNALMARKGLPVRQMTAFIRHYMESQYRLYPPAMRLAKACALEHFTALFADRILGHPALIEGFDVRMRPLWLWHAIEESEHKSVVFDVYQEQVGSYWLRASTMMLTTLEFAAFMIVQQLQLVVAAGEFGNVRSLARAIRYLAGHQGLLHGLGAGYLAYYRRDFHPARGDVPRYREQGLEMLGRLLGRSGGVA